MVNNRLSESASIILFGGGHVHVVLDILEQLPVRILGVVDNNPLLKNVCSYPVLGLDKELGNIKQLCSNAVVAVGQIIPETRKSF